MTNIKHRALKISLLLWLISACAYEPKTIVKTPRNVQISLPSGIKDTRPIMNSLSVPLSKRTTANQIQPIPIVGIDLSNLIASLIGLNKLEIKELLDKPSFKRTEHPASIWQYQSPVCFIDIFFYSNKNVLIVDYVEVRSKSIKKITEKLCFSSLLDSEYHEKKSS